MSKFMQGIKALAEMYTDVSESWGRTARWFLMVAASAVLTVAFVLFVLWVLQQGPIVGLLAELSL